MRNTAHMWELKTSQWLPMLRSTYLKKWTLIWNCQSCQKSEGGKTLLVKHPWLWVQKLRKYWTSFSFAFDKNGGHHCVQSQQKCQDLVEAPIRMTFLGHQSYASQKLSSNLCLPDLNHKWAEGSCDSLRRKQEGKSVGRRRQRGRYLPKHGARNQDSVSTNAIYWRFDPKFI